MPSYSHRVASNRPIVQRSASTTRPMLHSPFYQPVVPGVLGCFRDVQTVDLCLLAWSWHLARTLRSHLRRTRAPVLLPCAQFQRFCLPYHPLEVVCFGTVILHEERGFLKAIPFNAEKHRWESFGFRNRCVLLLRRMWLSEWHMVSVIRLKPSQCVRCVLAHCCAEIISRPYCCEVLVSGTLLVG